tara:strand:+ start:52 stop:228 length:177 start_codon:yes stop_codon:yes gene_type:complete
MKTYIEKMSNEKPHKEYEASNLTYVAEYETFTYKFSVTSGYSWIEVNGKVISQRKISY